MTNSTLIGKTFIQVLLLFGLPWIVWIWLLAFILDPREFRPIQISMFSYLGALLAEFFPALTIFLYVINHKQSLVKIYFIRLFAAGVLLWDLWLAPMKVLMEAPLNPLYIVIIAFLPHVCAKIISVLYVLT